MANRIRILAMSTALLVGACGGKDDNCAPGDSINIDFACRKLIECTSPTETQLFHFITCADLGYSDECCSGEQCGSDGPSACKTGEVCKVISDSSKRSDACATLPTCQSDADCAAVDVWNACVASRCVAGSCSAEPKSCPSNRCDPQRTPDPGCY